MKPYFDQGGIVIYHAMAADVMATLPDHSVDLIATDPPYFRVKNEPWDRQWDNRDRFVSWIGSLCDEWRRVLKPNGSLYVFASPEMSWHVEGEVRQRFNVLNTIRWVKEAGWHNKTEKEALRSFLSPWESIIFAEQFGDQYEDAAQALHKEVYAPLGRYIQQERDRAGLTRSEVEVALGFCSRSDPTRGTALCYRWEEGSSLPTKDVYERLRTLLNERGGDYLRREYEDLRREYEDLRRPFALTPRTQWADVWDFQTVAIDDRKHPCQKPLSVMEHIVRTSSKPDGLVFDCFMGHGSTLQAARNLGRRAIGVDANERYCWRAAGLLSQQVLSLTG
jgi:adenine-specific DNA-methyltransferase